MPKLVCHIEVRGSEFYVTHVIPPCADKSPNAAALAAFLAKARELEPSAFDPTRGWQEHFHMPSSYGGAIVLADGPQQIGQILAQQHHDEAEAPNPLNTGDTVGPGDSLLRCVGLFGAGEVVPRDAAGVDYGHHHSGGDLSAGGIEETEAERMRLPRRTRRGKVRGKR